MSVWEWVDVGLMNHDVELEPMKGSFAVTTGDAVAGFFGSRQAHIYGGDIKLVCDPEDMLFGKLEHFLPGAAAILGGVGGNTTWVYGSNFTATYVGPKMEIRRAPAINKTTDYVIARAASPPTVKVPPDEIDAAMAVAVGVLSVLICAVPAAMDLTFKVLYREHPPAEGDHLATKLKFVAVMVTTRLMALLKMLEEKGSCAQFAEQWGKEAALYLASAAVLLAIPIAWPVLCVSIADGSLQQVFSELAEALTED